jgi:hypothetical protein
MTAGKSRRHPHGPAQPALYRLVRMDRAGLKTGSRTRFYSLSISATYIALTRAHAENGPGDGRDRQEWMSRNVTEQLRLMRSHLRFRICIGSSVQQAC